MSESFEVSYAAHTASCTFLLDAEGICRRIVMSPNARRKDSARTASRCVGAQYVASLDTAAAGGLVEMPRVGVAMLFARVDEHGRVSLVRTGIVTRFETLRASDPFEETDAVRTSAPEITPRVETARSPRSRRADERDPYFDASERTQRIPALRMEEEELRTAEYPSAPVHDSTPPRATMPSRTPGSLAPTLRTPAAAVALEDDEDPYVRPRGVLPRRSDPYLRARAARPAPSDVQLAGRRRRDRDR